MCAVLREGGAEAEPPVTFGTGIGIILPEESPAVNLPVKGGILEILEQPAQGWASLSKGHNQAAEIQAQAEITGGKHSQSGEASQ